MKNTKTKKNTLQKNAGNAILISFGISTFLILASAGAGYIVGKSTHEVATIENSRKAFFAAEAATENALYAAAEHGPGWEEPAGALPDVPFSNINNSSAKWSVSSRKTMHGISNHTVFLPPKKIFNASLINWKKVPFRAEEIFPLFVDSTKGLKRKVPIQNTVDSEALLTKKAELENRRNQLNSEISNLLQNMGVGDPREYADKNQERESIDRQIEEIEQYLSSDESANTPPPVLTPPVGISTASNRSNLESIFFDVFVPVTVMESSSGDDDFLLSWSLTGTADIGGVSRPMNLFSKKTCGSATTPAGKICFSHFDDLTATPINVRNIYESDSETDSYGIGKAMRLKNPVGIFRDDDGKFAEANIRDFLIGNVIDADGNPMNFTLKNPKLILQFSAPKKGQMNPTGSFVFFSHLFFRVGFKFNSAISPAIIYHDFPIPDENLEIKTVGTSDNYKQTIKIEMAPNTVAPMFNYAIFQ